jgi:hypothetical protein
MLLATVMSVVAAGGSALAAFAALSISNRQTAVAAATFYTDLRSKFLTTELIRSRQKACASADEMDPLDPSSDLRRVLLFFEDFALLVRIKGIPVRLSWDGFGDYVICYYDTFEPIIQHHHSQDQEWYENFIWLNEKLKNYRRPRRRKGPR